MRFASRAVRLDPRWFSISLNWLRTRSLEEEEKKKRKSSQLDPQAPLRNLFSLSFVRNSFSIRILDTPPSRDTRARHCTHREGNERSPARDESCWQLLIST